MESELLNNTTVLQNSYQLPTTQPIYYVIYMRGYMFRPPSGHPQAVKIHTINTATTTPVMGGRLKSQSFALQNACQYKC